MPIRMDDKLPQMRRGQRRVTPFMFQEKIVILKTVQLQDSDVSQAAR